MKFSTAYQTASSGYVGPTSGTAIADSSAMLGGLGTGFERTGSASPYEVV